MTLSRLGLSEYNYQYFFRFVSCWVVAETATR